MLMQVKKKELWHFDSQLLSESTWVKQDNYESLELNQNSKEFQNLQNLFALSATQEFKLKWEIGKVFLVWNRTHQRMFEGRIKLLSFRSSQPAFQPKWHQDTHASQRKSIHSRFVNYTKQFSPQPEDKGVSIFAGWHGTSKEVVSQICSGGFASLATTDQGFFGKGLYFTNSIDYAQRVYSKGNILLLCWIATSNLFPVIFDDMSDLLGKPHFQNYDSHYVPVCPSNPNNPNEVVYNACKPQQQPVYDEFVVFDESQVFPRYIVHLRELESSSKPPQQSSTKQSSAEKWTVDDVCTWLKTLTLSKDYSSLFSTNAIDGSVLISLTADDLRSIGITTFGDIRKMEQNIKTLKS